MDKRSDNNSWIESLDYKAWVIAYEIADPEKQKEAIKELVEKYQDQVSKQPI